MRAVGVYLLVMANTLLTGRFVDPATVSTHFHIREGDSIVDLGAGSGYFTEVLSKLAGPAGRVYACEIQKELVDRIGVLARAKGLFNVDPLWCDIEMQGGVKVSTDAADVVIMVNTLFQFEDKQTALKEAIRVLHRGGKFFLIDWSESFGGLGPQPTEVISAQQAQALCEQVGFVYERTYDAGDHHYGLAFRKP